MDLFGITLPKIGQYDITVKYTGNTITLIGASAWYIKKYHYNN